MREIVLYSETMENFAVNAIYERNESGERSAEDEKWWFNSNRTNEDFFPLKRKEQEVVTRTHISRVESQIRMEKISRSSSMCDYDEECERMDCNDEEDDDDDDDDDSLLAVEDLKSSLATLQEQKNTKATTTKRKNDNNNDNDAKAGESFRGCTISQLLSFHDTDERKIPLHDIELHEDMLRDQLRKEQTKEHFVLNAATAKHVLRGQREPIISYILQCCAMANYNAVTADVCMVYVDRVLSNMDIPKSTLSLIAMCCLHIAVKYEEIEDVVLSTTALRNMFAPQYCQDTVLRMESALLSELGWKLGCVTTSHFIESILKICDGATHEFERIEKETDEEEEWTIDYVDKLSSMSLEMYKGVLADPAIRGAVLPSVLATACIGAARAKLGLFPAVTREMEVASNVSESNLSEIHGWLIEHCLNIYVARNDPDCVSSGDDYDKNNTIGSVAVPMRQGSNDNEKVKELTDEFGRFVDVYSPTGVLEASSLSSFRDDDFVAA